MSTTEKAGAHVPGPGAADLPTLHLLHAGCGRIRLHSPVELRAGETLLGRDSVPGLDGDTRLSRRHALVVRKGDELSLRDLGSTNGTFVEGRRIQESVVRDGALVRVGDSFLLVRWQPRAPVDAPVPKLLGISLVARELRRRLHLVAPSDATVVLMGESGTGKEVAARAIHEASRRTGPFVALNVSAIPEALAESQLFGHVAGAFTGARGAHDGFFRAAHRGTLFLDEIGELAPALQPKLLRTVEEKAVTPMGSTTAVPFDVRLVAATHRDLAGAVAAGAFRGDLLARLDEVTVRLPPLRERREDILLLLAHALGEPRPVLSPRLVEGLLLHRWPYNVRELFKVAGQLRLYSAGAAELDLDLVAERLTGPPEDEPRPGPPPPPAATAPRTPAPGREELVSLLSQYRGNVSEIARNTGRSRRQVRRWLEDYQLDAEQYRD